MTMLRCSEGHFLVSVKTWRALGSKHGMIADMFCKGCNTWVPADTRTNMLIVAGESDDY